MSDYPWQGDDGYQIPAEPPKPLPPCPRCGQPHEGPTPWCKGQETDQ